MLRGAFSVGRCGAGGPMAEAGAGGVEVADCEVGGGVGCLPPLRAPGEDFGGVMCSLPPVGLPPAPPGDFLLAGTFLPALLAGKLRLGGGSTCGNLGCSSALGVGVSVGVGVAF